MTTELDHLTYHPKIAGFETEERFPGMYRLRLEFTNGRGASIVGGPAMAVILPPGIFEIAQLTSEGECAPDVLGGPDIRRGTAEEIEAIALAIADLPPEETEITE